MAAAKNENILIFQIYLIGDSGVGKTCLLERFAERTFSEQYSPTSGAEFMTWTIPLEEKMIKLQINGVAGRKEYRTVTPDNFKKAHGFVIVYDVTNQELATKWGSRLFEASAKNDTNVAEIFLGIAADIKSRLYPQLSTPCMDAELVKISRLQKQIIMNWPLPAASLHLERSNTNQSTPADDRLRKPCDYTLHLFVIGDTPVGKSSLILRYTEHRFTYDMLPSLGPEMVSLDGLVQCAKFVQRDCYRRADGIILVYDVTHMPSFDSLNAWLDETAQYAREDTNKLLVGNKNDLAESKTVSHQSAQVFADQHGIPFLEASANSGENVEEIFEMITALIIKRLGPPRSREATSRRREAIRRNAPETNCRQF